MIRRFVQMYLTRNSQRKSLQTYCFPDSCVDDPSDCDPSSVLMLVEENVVLNSPQLLWEIFE